jgi:hypothetical protein
MPQAVAIPLITALAPTIIGGIGSAVGGKKKEIGYSSGLDPQAQQFRNWIMSMIQSRATQPQANNAQQFLYKHFGLGTPQGQTNPIASVIGAGRQVPPGLGNPWTRQNPFMG